MCNLNPKLRCFALSLIMMIEMIIYKTYIMGYFELFVIMEEVGNFEMN